LYVKYQTMEARRVEGVTVRPTQEELLATLRVSLNDTLVPAIEDRWARYVATAMDLVLQHLSLRVTGEHATLSEDGADMAAVLAGLTRRAADAGRAAEQAGRHDAAAAWESLALIAGRTPRPAGTTLAAQTRHHEQQRATVVDALRWLDSAEGVVDDVVRATSSDDLHHLVRRQTDRMTEIVRPLFMAFGPVAS
jgi:hypothetical protein